MRALFAERYPSGQFLDVDRALDWAREVERASTVVLLYPDAIGLGFGRIERRLAGRDLEVLNGRRRQFRLDRRTHAALLLRRAVEWTMAPELVLSVVFLIATPVLLVVDRVRGRR